MSIKTFSEWVSHYKPKFESTFGFKMPYDFMGLDLIKLEGILNVPETVSIKSYIHSEFGKKASDLIEDMLKNSPPFPR